ncbi:MAG: pentapeptide repeat-containing protein, partial [Promethearchaeota archaeon]
MKAIYKLEESWSDDKVKFAEGREVFFVHEGDKIKEIDLNGNLIKEFQIPEELHDIMWNIDAEGSKLVYVDVSENRLNIIDINKGTIEKTPVLKTKTDIPNILALYYVDDLKSIFILSKNSFIAYNILEKRFIRVAKNKWEFLNKDTDTIVKDKASKSFGMLKFVALLKDYRHIMAAYQYKIVIFKLEDIGKCLRIDLFTSAKMRFNYAFIPERSILLITNGLSYIDVYHLESGKYISRVITTFNIIRDINFDESAGRVYVLGKNSASQHTSIDVFSLETYKKISTYRIANGYTQKIYIVAKNVLLLEMYNDSQYGGYDYADIYYYNLKTSRLTNFMVAHRNTGWYQVGRRENYKIYDYIITQILPKLKKLIVRIRKRREDKDYQIFALDYKIIYNIADKIKDKRIFFNYDLFKFGLKFKCAFKDIYVKGPGIDNDDEFIEFDENVLNNCVLEDLWIAGGYHTMPKYSIFRNCKFKDKSEGNSKSEDNKDNINESVRDEFDLYFRGCRFENCLIEGLKFKEKFESSVFLRSKLVNTQFSGEISKGEFRECIFDRVEMNWYSGSLHTAIKLVDIKASDFAIRDVAGFTVNLEIEGGVFERCSFKNLISIKINGRNAVINGIDIENLKGQGFELDHCEVKNLKLDATYFKNVHWDACKFHDCEVLNSYGISVQVKDSVLKNFAIKDTGVLGLALLGLKPSECECNNFTGFFCNLADLASCGHEQGFKFKDSKLYYHNLNELKRSKSIIDVSEALKGLNTDETEKFAPIPPVYTTKFNHSWNLIEIASLDLSSINMEGAPLKDLVFKKCNLSGAKFSGCALEHIIFNESNLRGGDFTGAKLNNVKFTDADLDNINFASVKMGNCEILRSSMVGAKFSNANLNQVRANELILTGSDFSHSTLFDFSAKYIEIMENAVPVSFKQANLDQTYFGGSKLYECDFSEAAIGSLQIYKSNFNKLSFKGSEISELSINEMYEPKNDYKKIPKKIEEIEDYEQYLVLDDATIKKLYLAKLKIKLNIKGTAKISEMTLRSIFLGESDIVMNALKETKIKVDYALYKGGSSKIPDVLLTQEYFITTELKKLQNKKEVREYLAEISKVFDKIMETPGIKEYTKTLSQFLWSHIDLLKRDYIKQFSKIMDNGIDWSS